MVDRRLPGKKVPPPEQAKVARRLPGEKQAKWVPKPIRDISTVGIVARKTDPYLAGIMDRLKDKSDDYLDRITKKIPKLEEPVEAKIERRLPKVKLHPETVQPNASYGKSKQATSASANITYRSKPWQWGGDTKEVRKYFAGIFPLAIVEFGRKGDNPVRAHYSDGECPTLIKEFESEKKLLKWLEAQLELSSK